MEQEETVDARPRADKTVFNVTLEGVDLKNKIRIIKEVKGITNMPLRQLKHQSRLLRRGLQSFYCKMFLKKKPLKLKKCLRV